MSRWPGCTACGSDSVRMIATRERGTIYLCRAHKYACHAHLKDPCPVCDADGPAQDSSESERI